jgi:hypothetical protein
MARWYFDSTTAPAVSPDFAAEWDTTTDAVRRTLNASKQSSAMTDLTVNEAATAVANLDYLAGQWVSAPLPATEYAVTGYLSGQMRVSESNGATDARMQLVVRVLDDDGSTIAGTLFAGDTEALFSEFNFSTVNRRLPRRPFNALQNAVSAPAGHRLLVEVGFRAHNTSAIARTCGFRVGDTGAVDLPQDELSEDDLVPWLDIVPFVVAPDVPALDPWTPALLSGATLLRWFDASQDAVTADGTVLSAATDASPNGVDIAAAPTPGVTAPTLEANELNGLAVYSLNGSTYFDSGAGIGLDAQPFSVAMVVKSDAAAVRDDYWTGRDGVTFATRQPTTGDLKLSTFADTDVGFVYGHDLGTAWHVHVHVVDGANSVASLDGVAVAGATDAASALASGVTIGWDLTFAANSLTGDVAEIAFLAGALSSADRQRWEGYLAHKYGLEATLPSTHPYKAEAPAVLPAARRGSRWALGTGLRNRTLGGP